VVKKMFMGSGLPMLTMVGPLEKAVKFSTMMVAAGQANPREYTKIFTAFLLMIIPVLQ